jgi:hypothetical protein
LNRRRPSTRVLADWLTGGPQAEEQAKETEEPSAEQGEGDTAGERSESASGQQQRGTQRQEAQQSSQVLQALPTDRVRVRL